MGLFDLFSNDSAEKAARDANAGATAGYGQLSDLYGQGRGALTTNFGQAGDLYKNLFTSYAPGANAYGDASGANGPAGYTRATANFQANPGYKFQMNQGLQALDRTHAAAGNLNSGNADADTLNFATGLADKSYGGYLAGLQPYLGGQAGAVAGAAGVDTGLGTALNTNFSGVGNAANATQTTIGNNNAGADLNNYKVSSNLWNGLMGGVNFLSGGAGGQGGAGGFAKNANNLFSAFA